MLLAQYEQYNMDQGAIRAAFALVETAEQAHTAKMKETGEAQQATKERDARLDVLDGNMAEFYALARLACEDAPQLLEKYATRLEVGYRRLQAEGIR